ncbi:MULTISPECIES: hypothetical protein [unclassified Microcystis]|uniref:hypothetical protein n=1 Tax=unclassified Microcystis TaxID=2643300 RepID=UPI0022C37CEE|nr:MULTISPECIES: hypothetical protein [unclassified Microcystis]MCZ8048525.1 hypothetical protein [Microcystis sp. LE19-41.2A]MCZ8290292.1 hypothetical protein [Microcystis sp. LE19-59.1C]
MRKILRERSRNSNREVWESPSVLRRRGCQPAGRVYREALQFSVSGQTSAVMENSLGQLLWLGGQCYD